jgi:hypothetical protein
MAIKEGFTRENCDLMIAHLYHECGSMTEDCGWVAGSMRSDAGLAIGIAQWHLCFREAPWMRLNKFRCPHGNPKKAAPIREKFFKDFPEMLDWRYQAKRYLNEIKNCTNKKKLKTCIDSWNASPAYMSYVIGKVPMAKRLLN